jgi:hypothetical protein
MSKNPIVHIETKDDPFWGHSATVTDNQGNSATAYDDNTWLLHTNSKEGAIKKAAEKLPDADDND